MIIKKDCAIVVFAESVRFLSRVSGMNAENNARVLRGEALAYNENDYYKAECDFEDSIENCVEKESEGDE